MGRVNRAFAYRHDSIAAFYGPLFQACSPEAR
jgi:hypothetical protein